MKKGLFAVLLALMVFMSAGALADYVPACMTRRRTASAAL